MSKNPLPTHPPTPSNTHPPQHTHPNTPIPTPSDSKQTSQTHSQTHPHTPPSLRPHPHKQNGYFENKRFFFVLFFVFILFCFLFVCLLFVFFSKNSNQFNSLWPCIWIDNNLHWVSFGKLTCFQGIHFLLSAGLFFLLHQFM